MRIFVAQGLYYDAAKAIRILLDKSQEKQALHRMYFHLLYAWVSMFAFGTYVQAVQLALGLKSLVIRFLEAFGE